jgi:hypothetical protein
VAIFACEKSNVDSTFNIDPNKVYTPTEVNRAGGKCNKTQPWENKIISVAGYFNQPILSETENNGKFWLKDLKTDKFIDVYVRRASLQEIASIYQLVAKSLTVTVTGKAVAGTMQTPLSCRKSLQLEINQHTAIKP